MDSMLSSYKIHLNVCLFSPHYSLNYKFLPCCRPWTTTYRIFSRKRKDYKFKRKTKGHFLASLKNFWYSIFIVLIVFECPYILQRTIHVDRSTLLTLTQGSLETSEGITVLEEAAAVLYRALLASRDNG